MTCQPVDVTSVCLRRRYARLGGRSLGWCCLLRMAEQLEACLARTAWIETLFSSFMESEKQGLVVGLGHSHCAR